MSKVRRKAKKPGLRVIGLTGGLGSGKSTVLAMLRRLGAKTEDADRIVHEALAPDGAAYRRVLRLFGPSVLCSDRSLDRARIADQVFRNARLRKSLEKILHPIVIRRLRKAVRGHREGILVMDVPLLFETGLDRLADETVVVWAPLDMRLRRMRRRGWSRAEVLRRVRAQISLGEKRRRSDIVINNGGTKERTRRQILRYWKTLQN